MEILDCTKKLLFSKLKGLLAEFILDFLQFDQGLQGG